MSVSESELHIVVLGKHHVLADTAITFHQRGLEMTAVVLNLLREPREPPVESEMGSTKKLQQFCVVGKYCFDCRLVTDADAACWKLVDDQWMPRPRIIAEDVVQSKKQSELSR
jgi:hypothetical protein